MGGKAWGSQFRLKPSRGAKLSQLFLAEVGKTGITDRDSENIGGIRHSLRILSVNGDKLDLDGEK